MNRREFLEAAAIGTGAALLGFPAQAQSTTSLGSSMAQAANSYLASLPSAQKDRSRFAFESDERTRWHWTVPSSVPRNGLPLEEMNPNSRKLALALLRSSLSEVGYAQAVQIIALQLELNNDDGLYYVSVFGNPGSARWGWRFEGHHFSRHFTVVGDRVSMTPFFLGAWPTRTNAGARAMPREEDAARELVKSLGASERRTAIFQVESLREHVTQNAVRVSPLEPVGIVIAQLNAAQQGLALEIVSTFLNTLPKSVGAPLLERSQRELSAARFGWAGSLEPGQPQYYRIQAASFLLEFDNSRNGGTHIHSVWREFAGDFGANIV
jgi:Protein of unknown function (DUF3500)